MNALTTIEDLLRNPGMQIRTGDFILALVLSVVSALIIAGLYAIFYENRSTGSRIHRSFLLLSPSITALFIAIQFSLPLSLGLVGALTIIRFRTPIKEPEEVAFIMLVIATSIVCATFHYLLLGILLAIALVVLVLQKFLPRLLGSKRDDGMVLLTVEGDVDTEARQRIMDILEEKVTGSRVQSISFSDHVTTVHYSFTHMKSQRIDELNTALERVVPVRKLNILFNRQGVMR